MEPAGNNYLNVKNDIQLWKEFSDATRENFILVDPTTQKVKGVANLGFFAQIFSGTDYEEVSKWASNSLTKSREDILKLMSEARDSDDLAFQEKALAEISKLDVELNHVKQSLF